MFIIQLIKLSKIRQIKPKYEFLNANRIELLSLLVKKIYSKWV